MVPYTIESPANTFNFNFKPAASVIKGTRTPELTRNVVSFVRVNLEVGPNVVDPGEEVESVPGALARCLLPRLHPVHALLLSLVQGGFVLEEGVGEQSIGFHIHEEGLN